MGAATAYQYENLTSPRSIRLLCLEPCSNGTGELRAHFLLSCIDQPPEYEALSYTWGEPVFPERLHVGDAIINITANLARALLYFRRMEKPRALWIDAVCINQDNVQEKGQQVSIMGNIYRNAKRVMIWLDDTPSEAVLGTCAEASLLDAEALGFESGTTPGPTVAYRDGKKLVVWPGQLFSITGRGGPLNDWAELDPREEISNLTLENGMTAVICSGERPQSPLPPDAAPLDGFALVGRVAFEHMLPQSKIDFCRAILLGTPLVEDITIFTNVIVEKILRHSLDKVYTNAWFTRMWIVQEVCLASEAVLCHRGQETDWTDFSKAMTLLHTIVDQLGIPPMPKPSAFARALELVRISALYKLSTVSSLSMEQRVRSISRLSQSLRGQECKFDQDRIYALLSLQPQGSPLSMVPDYTQPALRVFRDFAGRSLGLGMIETLYDAGIWDRMSIQFPGAPGASSDYLPSWAPDYRTESRSHRLPWLKEYFRHQLDMTMDACSRGPSLSPLGHQDSKLNVDILAIDTIWASRYEKFPSRNFVGPASGTICFEVVRRHVRACEALYKQKATAVYPIYSSKIEPESAFWATMVAYSAYSQTPVVFPDTAISLDVIRAFGNVFRKTCLDKGGLLFGGEESVNVDVARFHLLERMGPEGSPEFKACYTALKFYDVIRETLDRVRFFVTKAGYIGLAPPTLLRPDDLAVMIRGSRIPFILRRTTTPDSYVLVGSCYLFGLMDLKILGEYRPAQLF